MRSDTDLDAPADRSRGGLLGLVTLPFRAVGATFGIAARLLTFLILLVGAPARLGLGAVRAVVALAADLVYALWRAAMVVVRAVLGTFALLVGAVLALVGLVRRVIMAMFGLVFTLLALVLKLVKAALTAVAVPVAAVVGITITIARFVLVAVRTVLKVVIGIVLLPLRPFGLGKRREQVEYVAVDDASEATAAPDAA